MWMLSAVLMGFASSLHCIGMCGPLMLALPQPSNPWMWFGGRGLYQLGRILSYCILGMIFGILKESISLTGFQQTLSIIAGISLLIILLFPKWENLLTRNPFFQQVFLQLKKRISAILQHYHLPALFNLGIVNGFLPCGMVYMALAASLATPSMLESVGFMFFFGIATLPATVALMLAGKKLNWMRGRTPQYILQILSTLIIILLIIRGLDLNIPYLSPGIDPVTETTNCVN
ncbi:MAG: sulfite exporter TauE/SafE family protein [Bacteroidota bacterium]